MTKFSGEWFTHDDGRKCGRYGDDWMFKVGPYVDRCDRVHSTRDQPMTAEQTAIEVERLRQKLQAPKGSDIRRAESTRAAMARMRPKPTR